MDEHFAGLAESEKLETRIAQLQEELAELNFTICRKERDSDERVKAEIRKEIVETDIAKAENQKNFWKLKEENQKNFWKLKEENQKNIRELEEEEIQVMFGKGNCFGITEEERSVRLSRLETAIANAKAENTQLALVGSQVCFLLFCIGEKG